MKKPQDTDQEDRSITVELEDGSIVRLNSVDHRENPNGNGLLFDVDYDIIKLGSLPEDQVFGVMWEKVKPTFMHVVMQDPEVRAGVEARLKARRKNGDPAEQAPQPGRSGPRH